MDSKILVLSPSNRSESHAYEGDKHAPLHLQQQHTKQQQPEHGPVAMNRNMSENEHSAATTTSSMSTQLASPVTTLTKNADSNQIDTWGCEQHQHYHHQHGDETDDFYSGQQSPLLTAPPHPSTEVHALSPNTMPPSMVDSNDSENQYQNAMVRMGTPPSTLYHEHPATHIHLIPTDAAPTVGDSTSKEPSNTTNANSNSSKKSKCDTDVSPAGPAFLGEGGDNTVNANNGATRKSRRSQQQQPVLYSAIGSLENCSAHSLKDIRRKNKQQQQPGGNGFHSSKYTKFDTVHLIAPTPSANHMNILTSQQPPSSSSILSQQQTPGSGNTDSANTTAAGQASAQSTPDKFGDIRGQQQQPSTPGGFGHHHQQHHHQQSSELKESLRTMQAKIDARNRQHCSAHSNHNPRVSMPMPATQEDLADTVETEATLTKYTPKKSSMRKGRSSITSHDENGKPLGEKQSSKSSRKSVTIEDASLQRKQRKSKKPMEMFRPSSDAYTPRMGRKKITYKPAAQRTPVQKMATTMGTLSRPNFRDALRRVAMLMRQHIVKIEQRFQMPDVRNGEEGGLFKMSMKDAFSEEKFATCRYKCTVVRVPMARPGMVFGMKKIRPKYEIPSEEEIYEFAHQLFQTVQLSSECSIVCLIYIERLMEISKVPLLASTWRPIFLCGLLLASKVWQDLSSWNIEFASVYPQFSLDAINKLELQFLRMVKWDLYISSRLVLCISLDGIIAVWELFANPVFFWVSF